MSFQIGNKLGGRKNKTPQQILFEEKCRDWSALHAFKRLEAWVNSKDPKVSCWALGQMLDRGFGKPVETSFVDAYVTAERGIGVEEIREQFAAIAGSREAKAIGVDPVDPVDAGK